ncbi:MAG: right-handed parallel beta-helix repeat-containing protein [Bacteroidales bacterium]|nr:right-handed parallel beta-helix repeat-containing protein [Bacteroidales bacterium]
MVKKQYILILILCLLLIIPLHAEKYALLITGTDSGELSDGVEHWCTANYATSGTKMEEFWYDTYLMWEMLYNQMKYSQDNIFTFYSDGDEEGGDYDHPNLAINGAATKNNIMTALDGFANGTDGYPQLTNDDFLFIWTFSHGNYGYAESDLENKITTQIGTQYVITSADIKSTTPSPYSILQLNDYDGTNPKIGGSTYSLESIFGNQWNSSWPKIGNQFIDNIDKDHSISSHELKAKLDNINANRIVVCMQQCMAGKFPDVIKSDRTIVFTAAGFNSDGDMEPAAVVDNSFDFGGNTYNAAEKDGGKRHGEFNFHLYSVLAGETPLDQNYYDTDYTNYYLSTADLNSDGEISMYEAKTWEMDKESAAEHPEWSDQGNISSTTSLKYPTLLSNNITSSMTIRGDIGISNSITVSSGVTLSIAAGASIKVKPGKSLTINGKLVANGTSNKPIVFESMDASSSWNGIQMVNADDNSSLKYCEVKGATNGIVINNCDPDIEQCYIHSNSSDGIYMTNYASPNLYHNTISNNSSDGVYCYNSCSPTFSNNSFNPGYNEIKNNSQYGIYASNNTTVHMGMTAAGRAVIGYNAIHSNNSYETKATSSSTINAEWCYWTNGTPTNNTSADATSNIYTVNYLGTNPCIANGGSNLAKTTINYSETNPFDPEKIDKNDPVQLLYLAMYYKNQEEFDNAEKVLKDLIKRFPESDNTISGLGLLYNMNRECKKDIEYYCKTKINEKNISDKLKQTAYEILVSKYMKENQSKEAMEYCNKLINEFPNTDSEIYAYYNLCLLLIDSKSNDANTYLSAMKTKAADNPLTLHMREIMGEKVDLTDSQTLAKKSYESANTIEAATTFKLNSAYPNPFNPSTNISFTLAKQSKVDIKIYNLNGAQVWNYSSGVDYGIGNHNIVWNAIDGSGNSLSTGVYFIKFVAGKNVATQKVIFMK